MTDDTTLSGARFSRLVGHDPDKWAAAFLGAYAQSDGVRTDADRQAFVAAWFRDAMDAAVKAAAPQALQVAFQNAPSWPTE